MCVCPPSCPVQAKKPPKPDDSDETHWYVALSSSTSYTRPRPVTNLAVPYDGVCSTFFPVTNWAKRVQRGDARRAVLGDATCW